MDIPISKQQVEDIISRVFNANRDALKDNNILTWKQWIREDPEGVSLAIQSDYGVYRLYLKNVLNDNIVVEDIIQAYLEGKLKSVYETKQPIHMERIQFSPAEVSNKQTWQKQHKQVSENEAKSIYEQSIQKLKKSNQEEVLQARKDLYILYNTDADLAIKIGVSKSELNKKIRQFSGLSMKRKEIEDSLNAGISDDFHWTGITNSTFLGQQRISHDDLDKFVKDIHVTEHAKKKYSGELGNTVRKYIANVFLSIDTHISYTDLSFVFETVVDKTSFGGQYINSTKSIHVNNMYESTIAHEIGHYLDYKWGEQLIGSHQLLSRNPNVNHDIPEDYKKWHSKFNVFLENLMKRSDTYNSYRQDSAEVFARFVAKFTEWTSNHKYIHSEIYDDDFRQQDFHNFIKLLQEKTYLDATIPIKTARNNEYLNIEVQTSWFKMSMYKPEFFHRQVSSAQLSKLFGVILPDKDTMLRINKMHVGKNCTADMMEIQQGQNWNPLSFYQYKIANKKVIPWAILSVLLGLTGLNYQNQPEKQEHKLTVPSSEYVDLNSSPKVPQITDINETNTKIEQSKAKQPKIEQPKTKQNDKKTKQSRGIRNNNPGNIERSKIKWNGMSKDQSSDSRFIVFEYPQDGIRSMARVLQKYQSKYKLDTIEKVINRWAPPSENNVTAYVNYVSKKSGISPKQKINLNDSNTLLLIMSAMIEHENGYMPYDNQTLLEGIQSSKHNDRPWVKPKTKDMKRNVNNSPILLDSPKYRQKNVPQSFIRPFDTKQVEIFDKQAFENVHNIQDTDALSMLMQAVKQVGTNWKDIVHVLIEEYHVPREMMSEINREYLDYVSKTAKNKHIHLRLSS